MSPALGAFLVVGFVCSSWSLATALDDSWPEGTLTYTMIHDSEGEIGVQTVISKRFGKDVFIKIDEQVDVSKFGVAVYHSKAERWERWRDNRLVSFKSVYTERCAAGVSFFASLTGHDKICEHDQYEMPMEVHAWAEHEGFTIKGARLFDQPTHCIKAPPAIVTANFLNPRFADRTQPLGLIDSTTGELKQRTFRSVKPTEKGIDTSETRQYIYLGDPRALSDPNRVLSYDENGIRQSMRIEESGVTVSRQSISKQSTVNPSEWDIPKTKRQCR
ncbi:MAG: DUF6134 family protein [Nitrospiraceae bacterium]